MGRLGASLEEGRPRCDLAAELSEQRHLLRPLMACQRQGPVIDVKKPMLGSIAV